MSSTICVLGCLRAIYVLGNISFQIGINKENKSTLKPIV